MTFEEFIADIEASKERAYQHANFALYKAVTGEDVTSRQLDAAKYVIDRKDGKPTQKIGGDKNHPIQFLPSELMNKYGIDTSTSNDSEGQPQVQGS